MRARLGHIPNSRSPPIGNVAKESGTDRAWANGNIYCGEPPARWGNVRCLGVHADVLQNLPHLCSIGDERDQAHLP